MLKLTKADGRRAMLSYQFQPSTVPEVFERLRSVQFDPLAPVGCNHDLVLQARVPGYKVGDWQKTAYTDRLIYDGWDKQASLVAFSGWALRRAIHRWQAPWFTSIFEEHSHAVEAVLKELRERGPLTPKELEFQEHKPEWRGSWFGPNLSKQTLRALWHTGQVMTHSRRGQHHVYDLTERIVPAQFYGEALEDRPAHKAIILDRHRSAGWIRNGAPYEIWAIKEPGRQELLKELVAEGSLIEIEFEGMKGRATPDFLPYLDSEITQKVTFLAPLDHLIWDRNVVRHLFDFNYLWEVYTPEPKRVWGYYVLPVLFGERIVARFDVFCRKGILELRTWHWEPGDPGKEFWPAFEEALKAFKAYCGASSVVCGDTVDKKVAKIASKKR